MKRRWRALVRLLSRREQGTSLALFRIAVALVMLYSVLTVVLHGLTYVLWVDRAYGGMRTVRPGFWLLGLFGEVTPTVMGGLIAVSLFSSVAMLLGWGGRATTLLALWSYRSVSTAGMSSGGYDSMIFDAAWLLVLSQSTATLSLDTKLRTGRWSSSRRIPAWPRYLVILQLVVVYLATGLQKASASWFAADGYSALYWFLQDPTWIRFNTEWTVAGYVLTQLATFVTWHFEVGAPLLLLAYYYRYTAGRAGRVRAWFNRISSRKIFAAIGISMHLGILLLLDMGPFSFISISYYLCLLRPAEANELLARVAPGLALATAA